ncbi:MAG: hypothetical protein ACR2KK_19015 [Acidimicrobiales bacterium]
MSERNRLRAPCGGAAARPGRRFVTPVTLEEYTELSVEELKNDKAVTAGQAWTTTLSGTPGRRILHRTTDDGGRQYLSVWTVRSQGVWLVTYTSDAGPGRFGGALTEVERMLTTMKLPA